MAFSTLGKACLSLAIVIFGLLNSNCAPSVTGEIDWPRILNLPEQRIEVSSAEVISDEDRQRLEGLAWQFAPELRMHPDEQYPLWSVDEYLKYVGLIHGYDPSGVKVLINPGKINSSNLDNQKIMVDGKTELSGYTRPPDQEGTLKKLWLYIPKSIYNKVTSGEMTSGDPENEATCYAYPHFIDNGDKIEISYSFFYPFNGSVSSGIGLTGAFETLATGQHEGDLEHIVVRLDKTGTKVIGIHIAAHGGIESKWFWQQSNDPEKTPGYKLKNTGQPIIYSAKDTHASYPYAGTIKRKALEGFGGKALESLGVLADLTSDKGVWHDCRKNLTIFDPVDPMKTKYWLRFRGRYGYIPGGTGGEDGPEGLPSKDWWYKQPIEGDNKPPPGTYAYSIGEK